MIPIHFIQLKVSFQQNGFTNLDLELGKSKTSINVEFLLHQNVQCFKKQQVNGNTNGKEFPLDY